MAQNMKKKFLLYDCQDLTSKLKPAFEEEEEQISDQFRRKVSKSEGTNSNSKPSEASGFATIPGNIWGDFDETEPISEDLSKLTVSSNKSCSTCGVTFDSTDEQRAHFKLDWHRFNIANKLKGNLKAITEEQFEEQLDNLSLSGSESDESETEEDILSEKTSRLPKLFMTNSDNPLQVYSIYRAILPDLKEKTTLKWAVFMLGGGHFAGAIFDNGIAILHKTFHCYTVRAKQGGSQGSADNKSGGSHPKSAGASLRRYNEQSLVQHVQDILVTWKDQLEKCSLIFHRAVSGNQKVLFGKVGKDDPIVNKKDPRVVTIPFPTRRATFKEVKRVHELLMTIDLHNETVDELRSKLIESRSSRNASKTVKKSQIRRSKSRETPRRELPDFVQSLADEAKSESDTESGFLNSDLQEFDVSTTGKRNKKAKKSEKRTECLENELQNSLVTACKSGDIKLLNLLLQTNNLESLKLNQALGESKVTFLHIASKEGHGKIIQVLLENGADPTLKDKAKKTPYSYCPEKNSRTVYRKYQGLNTDQWDYIKAGLPQGQLLTPEEEMRQASKKAEKKKAQRATKKEKEKEIKEIEKVQKKEEEDKTRFLNLSDREKRAIAAERRILAQNQDLPSVPRCFQCGVDISGKVPFEYSDYKFCKPACVKEHRNKSKPSLSISR